MSNLYEMPLHSSDPFDRLLDTTLRTHANPTPNPGLETRLTTLYPFELSSRPERSAVERPAALPLTRPAPGSPLLFTTAARVAAPRSRTSTWTALALHAAAILLIAFAIGRHIQIAAPTHTVQLTQLTAPPPPPPPITLKRDALGGGGGQHDLAPATQGHLPKLAQTQILPPKAPPTIAPKLALEPTVIAQPDLHLADNKLPDLGLPNSSLKGFSLGNGSGTGLGSGNGSGIGPGSGGNTGGGIYHVGGSVRAPAVIHQVEAEFSEEARKAKFSGNAYVSLVIDEAGHPQQVRCARDIGMGLCDKAVEAVQQWRFRPATRDGHPVKVAMTVVVDFQVF